MDDTLLLRYLDGDLDSHSAVSAAKSLRRDPALRRRVAELRAVEIAYQTGNEEAIPSGKSVSETMIGRLRREPTTSPYDLIRRADLGTLSEMKSDFAPVFSLYLDLQPKERMTEPPLARFKSMLREVRQQMRVDQQSLAYREQWEEEVERMRTWLETQRPFEGRGLVLLSCQSTGLWRVFRLPVPVRDRLVIGDRPYLRPLVTLLDEFECYLVVLIDSDMARIMKTRLGMAEEISSVQKTSPSNKEIVSGKPTRRAETYLRRHARSVAERVQDFWREMDCERLVIGGTEKALGELRRQLPKALKGRLTGELHLSPKVELSEILEHIRMIEAEQERAVEAQRVRELVTTAQKSGAAVLGLEPTLLAIMERNVRLFVVEEDLAQPGWECPNCHYIGIVEQETCPLCGVGLHPQPDIIELALERVMDQDGDIEVLRGQESRYALTQYGGIGALLRFTLSSPEAEFELKKPEEALHDPTIHQEALIDEALEETFPASDPPAPFNES